MNFAAHVKKSAMTLSAVAALAWPAAAPAQSGRDASRPSPAPAASQAKPEDLAARYGILTEKNIFVRNRPPTRRGNGPAAAPSGPRRPEESLVLTGIAIQEGRHVAFVENGGTRSTQRLVPGDSVAGGKVLAVDFDGLDFETNGRRVRVAVGRNFLGTTSGAGSSASTTPSGGGGEGGNGSTTAPAGDAPPATDAGGGGGDGNMSAVERMMRERRRNQSGGR